MGAHTAIAAALLASRLPPAAPDDPSPLLAGETFELPAPETAEVPTSNAAPSPENVGAPAVAGNEDAPSPPVQGKHPAPTSHPRRPSVGQTDAGQAESAPRSTASTPGLYGAVGERSAADLATAFTRGFPQAASADPAWRTVQLGPAGQADVVLTIDDSGHIESTRVLGSPSEALASAIRRTLALIKGRAFVARAKVTTLHLVAVVNRDTVHDGLHGDVFAIGGSFSGAEGSAFFALAIGRRIDVHVRSK